MCDTAGRPIDSMSEAQKRWKRELQETIQPNRRERKAGQRRD